MWRFILIKSERLCATMKVYDMLKKDSPYQKDDMVEGIIYDTSDNFGLFVAVDNQYSALIPKKRGIWKTSHWTDSKSESYGGEERRKAGSECQR